MTRKRCFLDGDTVRKLLKEASKYNLTDEPVQFHLMGEPLLVKDLFDYITYAHDMSLKVRLFTNGALLDEKTAGKLYACGLEELVIGVQVQGRASFEANRRGKIPYDTYIKNIKSAIREKYVSKAETRIYIHYLNTWSFNRIRANQGYSSVFSPELIDTNEKALAVINEWKEFGQAVCREKGLDFTFTELECFQGEFRQKPLMCHIGDHAEILPGVILGFKAINTFSDWLMNDVRYVEKHRGTCSSIHEQMVVLADGRSTLCCVDYDGRVAVGDVRKNSLVKLWNSKPARKARKQMDKGWYPSKLCRICKAYVVPDDYDQGFTGRNCAIKLIHGFYSLETEDNKPFRWTGKTSEIQVTEDIKCLQFEMKNAQPMNKSVSVRIQQGQHHQTFKLPPGVWKTIRFPLKNTHSHGTAVTLETDLFFIPRESFKDSIDVRELAVMVSDISGAGGRGKKNT
jgi:MoaA/NifB/PqqE/SkfB family radical SAM enzyme